MASRRPEVFPSGRSICVASPVMMDPYLRPLYDALFDMLGAETYQKYLERGNIEVAPLAYMRPTPMVTVFFSTEAM